MRDEGTAYQNITAKLSELSKKMAAIEREMNLERAMYPKNIMRFEQEISGLKANHESIKGVLETHDSEISNSKIFAGKTSEKKLFDIEKSLQEISGRISYISDFKKSFSAFEKEFYTLKSEIENDKKRMTDIGGEIDAIKMPNAMLNQLSEKIKKAEELKIALDEHVPQEEMARKLKSIAEENKVLRQEIEQLKQVCAEIVKETQQQPIIID